MRNKGVKVFYGNLYWVGKIKSLSTIQILDLLLFKTRRNSAILALEKGDKTRIAERLGISMVTLYRGFAILDEYGIVRKDGVSYILNPRMYWYGDLPVRNRAIIKYDDLFRYLKNS